MNVAQASVTTADGLRLAVVEQGPAAAESTPTVLLVHGYPDNSALWTDAAARLADRFHVVRYDVRGTGASDQPADRDGYRLDALAADIVAVADAASPDAPVHLVGHDWGSIQGWHAITDERYADRFASYTSISGPCLDHVGYWVRDQFAARRFRPVLRQLAHSWYIGFFQLPWLPEQVSRRPELLDRLHANARDARNGLELYRANMLRRVAGRAPRRTSVPVQQIALSKDNYVLPALLRSAEPWCTRLWRRELPYGHWAPRTHPVMVADLVAEFIDHLRGGPASLGLQASRVVPTGSR
ncbi:MAG TPA: alpha/beta fold hydrolase [Pseudonocardiaceae bacterium]|jgi:pimeloyl-ACP methyl ester carboxylesterase|nr:alpha/beta fold hydrolase [Pseudonocardiaceae bacterium]